MTDESIEIGRTKTMTVNLSLTTPLVINAYLVALGYHPVVEILSYGGRAVVRLEQIDTLIELLQKAKPQLEEMVIEYNKNAEAL